MIEIGDEFNVKNEIGIVCFKGNYFNQEYICIAFEKEGKFGIYKVRYEGDKIFVAEESDKEKCSKVLSEFVTDELIEQNDVNKIMNSLSDKSETDVT